MAPRPDRLATSTGLWGLAGWSLEVVSSPQVLGQRVAALVLDALMPGPTGAPPRPLGLATGRTMEPVYGALVERVLALPSSERQQLVARWSSFNLDEYVGLGPADSESFAASMERCLGQPLGLPPGQLRLPDGLAPDPQREARRYGQAIAAAGGLGLQLLGLGNNGHVGFNEPPCAPDAPTRCLGLDRVTRQQNAGLFAAGLAAVPERAITVGLAEILAAETVVLVVSGEAKAEILRRSLEEPPQPQLPASWLQRHPRLKVLVDRAAASRLARGMVPGRA